MLQQKMNRNIGINHAQRHIPPHPQQRQHLQSQPIPRPQPQLQEQPHPHPHPPMRQMMRKNIYSGIGMGGIH
jgi:hypothetical protein